MKTPTSPYDSLITQIIPLINQEYLFKQTRPLLLPNSTHHGNQPTKHIFGYMRQKELMQTVPFSSATLWRKVKNGSFVKPKKLSDRITAWDRAEVYAWLESKEAA